jgi:hypothetical protein
MRAAATAKLWVWAVPCLLLFAVVGIGRHWHSRPVRLLTLSAASTYCGYLFVTLDQGHGWGYRYFHSAWGVIPVLAACAMTPVPARGRLAAFAGAAAVLSLLVVVPLQMTQIERVIARQLAQLESPRRPGNNVYFIDPGGGFYVADMIQIDPLLRDPDLLLASRGARLDAELVRQNWPQAVRVSAFPWVDQWYLGPTDQRRPTPGRRGDKRFVLLAPVAAVQ